MAKALVALVFLVFAAFELSGNCGTFNAGYCHSHGGSYADCSR